MIKNRELTIAEILYLISICTHMGNDPECSCCPLEPECYTYFTGDESEDCDVVDRQLG